MAPHFILEALNVDFELILVDRKSNAQKSKQYLALNPMGRIPTLVDNDVTLFESPAICMYLAEQNPNANLMPQIGTSERARCLQWMMYLTNTIQAELMVYFYPEKYLAEIKDTSAIIANQERKITEMFALLDDELANRQFLVSDNITICDYFLFMLAVWADEFKKPPLSFHYLGKYLRKLAKNTAIINVCQKENLSLVDYQ